MDVASLNARQPGPVLFILAPPRSFTSVTCAMIGYHPDMCGLPETNLFTADTYEDLSRAYKVRSRLQHGLLRSISELGLGGQTEDNVEAAREWLEENRSSSTAAIFEDLRVWAAPRGLVEKSPAHVYQPAHLARTRAAVPDAYYLHLTRHPRGTVESIHKMRTDLQARSQALLAGGSERRRFRAMGNEADITPDAMWLRPHENIVAFLRDVPPERQRRMHGEDLLSDPRRYLPGIAEWLGVRTDDEAIEHMLHPELSPFACEGPPNARWGNDPDFLQNPELRPYTPKPLDLDSPLSWDANVRLSPRLVELAHELGY
jgi:hypothetical protein